MMAQKNQAAIKRISEMVDHILPNEHFFCHAKFGAGTIYLAKEEISEVDRLLHAILTSGKFVVAQESIYDGVYCENTSRDMLSQIITKLVKTADS